MAGGTVAMPLINDGISLPREVMGLRHAGLDRIERAGDELRIGATATLAQLAAQRDAPLLSRAAAHTGSWAIRNMGTVGGNLFTPPPGGDVATALLALDAQVEVVSTRGSRSIPLSGFYTGFMTNALAPDELVAQLRVPLDAGATAFTKFGRRAANTPAVVTVAVHATLADDSVHDCRISLGGVGPHPLRANSAEAVLIGARLDAKSIASAAAAAAEHDCEPFSDALASDWYRRRMVVLFVGRALSQAAQSVRGKEG